MSITAVEVPEQITATGAILAKAIREGGYATVTVRSPSGDHVTVDLVVRKKNAGGQGWVSRATKAGRVGFDAGDAIEARHPHLEYPDNYVGRFYKDTGEWKAGKGADGKRVWVAERIITAALTGVLNFAKAEVFISTKCTVCGRKLTHPESIEELKGEECGGYKHSGKAAKTEKPAKAPEAPAAWYADVEVPGIDEMSPEQLLDYLDSARAAMTEPDASPAVREEMRKVIAQLNIKLGRPVHVLSA
jgi:hypothetical protein